MIIDSILHLCHDVYIIECTDEYEMESFMIGKCKYLLTYYSYPQKSITIHDPDFKIVFDNDPNCIKSFTPIYKDNYVASINLNINDDKGSYKLTLGAVQV